VVKSGSANVASGLGLGLALMGCQTIDEVGRFCLPIGQQKSVACHAKSANFCSRTRTRVCVTATVCSLSSTHLIAKSVLALQVVCLCVNQVTRLVRSNELNVADRQLVFEAIGFKFLSRLLRTGNVE